MTADQIEALARPVVDLPGGARLHIHPTPALVAIDVDAGGAIGAGRARTAAHLAVNRSVIPALARQIRLRNLSGAILVDFAGLPARRRAGARTGAGRRAGRRPACARGCSASPRLGLPRSSGRGCVRRLHELLAGPHAAGLAALRGVAAEHAAAPHRLPALRASPAVVAALQADAEALPDLARRVGASLDPACRPYAGCDRMGHRVTDMNKAPR